MKMLFKQRMFSWFGSYEIFDERGSVLFTVQGKPAWGHKLVIFDANGRELGTVRQKLLTFLPKYVLLQGEQEIGCISKEWSLFKPKYDIDFNGWHIDGNFLEWDYTVSDPSGNVVAVISKELFHWTDTYVIDVTYPRDALYALMFVLAIDAEKSSRAAAGG